MKIEEARELLEKAETDFSIKNRQLKGIQTISNYVNKIDFASGHDIIWISDFESVVEKMSKEDVEFVMKCGLFEDSDSWAFFT